MRPCKLKFLPLPPVKGFRRRFAAHPAQSMVEFALTLPLFLMMIFGIIEFARLLQAWLALENGARFAVRYAITGSYDYNFCAQAGTALDHANNRPGIYEDGTVINMSHSQLDMLDGIANCIVPMNYGGLKIKNHQEISGALQDWARLPSIRTVALTGATGIAWNPDTPVSGDYESYMDNGFLFSNLSQNYRGNPSLPGYFGISVCSNRVTTPDGNYYQFNPNPLYYSPVEPGDLLKDYRFPVFCQYVSASGGNSVIRYIDDAGGPGDRVRVVLAYRHTLITPIISNWWPSLMLSTEREGIVEKFRTSRVTGLTGSINMAATWTFTPLPNTETPTPTVTSTPSYCVGTGTILMEWWDGISGSSVSNLTGNLLYPAESTGFDYPTSFEIPSTLSSGGSRDNYGTRWRGYVCAPYTGMYTFWIASDDSSELLLSSNADPVNAQKISYVNGYTASHQWNKYDSTQRSVPIKLDAGVFYYIEARHKEGSGGDNMAVGWAGPGIGTSTTVIDGLYLKPVAYIPKPTRTATSTPAPDCSALTNLGGSEALMFRENNKDIESWISNNSIYNVRLTGAKLSGGMLWHNSVNTPPPTNNFRYYWGGSTLYDPPDTATFPISHNWPNTDASVISPGDRYLFRWKFANNFFQKPYVRSFPQPGSGTPAPSYEPGPDAYQGFFWPSDLNGEIYYAVGNPPGLTVTCTMPVTGGKGPEIAFSYKNGVKNNINTGFYASAKVTWNNVTSNKDYIYLYVYDSSGVLVHWVNITGSSGPLCLFGADRKGNCLSRKPYDNNWSYGGDDNSLQITNGTYTVVALAKGRTSSINGSRRTRSGMILDTFSIKAPIPTATKTPTVTNTPTKTLVPSITPTPTKSPIPSITLTPSKSPIPSITLTKTKSPLPPTKTETDIPKPTKTATSSATAAAVPTTTYTAVKTLTPPPTQPPAASNTPAPPSTRTPTATKTECQIPIEQGGCQ